MKASTRERILTFIADYSSQHGFSPTFREIADGLGYASVATVHKHISELKSTGLIADAGGKSRSLVLKSDISMTGKNHSDEQHVYLKTSDGGGLILSFVMHEGLLEFCSAFCVSEAHDSGSIIACCSMTEEAYDTALAKYAG